MKEGDALANALWQEGRSECLGPGEQRVQAEGGDELEEVGGAWGRSGGTFWQVRVGIFILSATGGAKGPFMRQ